MVLPEKITDGMSERQSDISVNSDADTEPFSQSIEEAREELEEFRDVLAEANAELAELNEALPAGSTAEIYKEGKCSYTEISRPDE
jgi:hypothetical protein